MKKKGFTLIELLAVIVVLAIIALIATPIVMNVIKKANEGAAERSADNYVKAVETLIATEKLDGTPLVDGTYTIESDGTLKGNGETYTVEVSGTKPVGGTVVITNGQVVKSDSTINYTDHTVTFKDGKAEAAEKGESSSELAALCDFLEEDTHNANRNSNTVGAKYTCNLGDGARTFYVLETGSNPVSNSTLKSNEVALILEGNYDMETPAWYASGYVNSCAADGLNEKLKEIAGKWTKLDESQIGIPSASQIVVADGQSEEAYLNYPTLTNEWLYSYPGYAEWSEGINAPYGYWTSTLHADISDLAWIVDYDGSVTTNFAESVYDAGVRPVITLEV